MRMTSSASHLTYSCSTRRDAKPTNAQNRSCSILSVSDEMIEPQGREGTKC